MQPWLRALRLVMWVLWPATTWATSITLDATLRSVPLLAWLMVCILSTVAGLAALLAKMRDETPPRVVVFVGAHMLGSWLAGLLLFFAGEAGDINDFVEAVSIALGSYAGARLMDRWADKFTDKVSGS